MSFSLKSSEDHGEGFGAASEINVTPFVDVMLVLLIVFMVTAPMLAQGIKVDLPRASSVAALPAAKGPLVLSLAEDGGLFIGAEAVAPDSLEARLKQSVVENPAVTAHIRAAASVPYSKVLDLMAALGRAGVTQIAFISRSEASAATVPAGTTP